MNSKYFCPILTSFNDDSTINYDDMHSLYDHVLENGIDGILVGGSAGEFYALDYNEAEQLISDAVQYINHRSIVIAGTGRMNRLETINLSNFALKKGADAVIIVGPYYSACSQEDVFNYFDDILGHISGNVYLYNYQDRTGYDISVNTVLRLLEKHKNLIGIKDTHPVSRHSQKYINEILPLLSTRKNLYSFSKNLPFGRSVSRLVPAGHKLSAKKLKSLSCFPNEGACFLC